MEKENDEVGGQNGVCMLFNVCLIWNIVYLGV